MADDNPGQFRGVHPPYYDPPDELVTACRDWAEVELGDADAGDDVATLVMADRQQRGEV